jgi:hypothetical protein
VDCRRLKPVCFFLLKIINLAGNFKLIPNYDTPLPGSTQRAKKVRAMTPTFAVLRGGAFRAGRESCALKPAMGRPIRAGCENAASIAYDQ